MTYQERKVLARQADIAEICRKMGVEIEKEKYSKKGEYRVVGHGGLVICANGYYCHSNPDGRLDGQPKDSGNNAISFVMYFFNKTYAEALDIILGDGYSNYTRHDTANYTPQPFVPAQIKQHPERSKDFRHLMAYLCKSRCLSPSVVQGCIDRGLLYEDTNRNAVFVCRDEQGQVIGYEIKGTNTNIVPAFKRTEGNAAFRFVCGDAPTGVIVFESAIDLLSYYELQRPKLTHHLLLSMAGCRYEILEQVLTAHPDYAVGVATDNDAKGKAFYESLCQQRADLRIFRVAPAHGKDWNDTLKYIRKGA